MAPIRNILQSRRRIDLLPFIAIALIVLVCNAANLFLLRRPDYILATLPISALSVFAAYRIFWPARRGDKT